MIGSQCELRAVRSLVTIRYLGKPGVELPTVIFSELITESEGESEGVGCVSGVKPVNIGCANNPARSKFHGSKNIFKASTRVVTGKGSRTIYWQHYIMLYTV